MINVSNTSQNQQAFRDLSTDLQIRAVEMQSETQDVVSGNKKFLHLMGAQTERHSGDYKQIAESVRRAWS